MFELIDPLFEAAVVALRTFYTGTARLRAESSCTGSLEFRIG